MFRLNGESRKRDYKMRYLHSMMRVANLDVALDFFCAKLGFSEVRRIENEKGRFTLVFLAAPGDRQTATSEGAPLVELTYNWDPEVYAGGRNFGHLAYAVDDIYATCEKLMAAGVVINRPPREGRMAFVRSPDGVSIELLQDGAALPPKEPWASMPNSGSW
jgi:lactoylglutathione lyase